MKSSAESSRRKTNPRDALCQAGRGEAGRAESRRRGDVSSRCEQRAHDQEVEYGTASTRL